MKSKIIVALDVDCWDTAESLVRRLAPWVPMFKIGAQLFTRYGPAVIKLVHDHHRDCFLDLKYHDIPNTVANAITAAQALSVQMLTVHTAGGSEMLRAAAAVQPRPRIVGVTVLTSVAGAVTDEVLRRAQLAADCGLDGVVASPHEIVPLRQRFGDNFVIVTPGIRPTGSATGDQQRIMTPAAAAAAGADYLVIGRPIIAAADPVAVTQHILAEIGD